MLIGSGSLLLSACLSLTSAQPPAEAGDDPLPAGVTARLGMARFRHTGRATAVVFLKGGQTLASAGHDGMIRLWDTAAGKQRRRLVGHKGEVYALALSPDGKLLVSGGADRSVGLWDPSTGREMGRLGPLKAAVLALAFAPDGRRLAVGDEQGEVSLWDVAEGQKMQVLSGPAGGVDAVSFAPDGRTLAATGRDGCIHFWDAATGKRLRMIVTRQTSVRSLAFAPDGKTLASASEDSGRVSLWDPATGTEMRRLAGHAGYVRAVVFSPDGKLLASAGADIRLWETATGKEVRRLPAPERGVNGLAFSADNGRLAAAHADGSIGLWEIATGKEVRPFPGHMTTIEALSFSPDGKRLASSSDGLVLIWDVATRKSLGDVTGALIRNQAAAFSPDGASVMVASEAGFLSTWGKGSGVKWQVAGGFLRSVFSADGKSLAVWRSDKRPWVLDAASGTGRALLDPAPCEAAALALSPDGQLLAVGQSGGEPARGPAALLASKLRLWHVPTRKDLWPDEPHLWDVYAVAFSPDGRRLATAEWETVRVWEVATGRRVLDLIGHEGRVHAVAFSPDGRILVSAGEDRTIRLWDITRGSERRRLGGHHGTVHALAFSPDGKALATAGTDSTILVWDAAGVSGPPRPPRELPPGELREAWAALGGADARRAYRAIWSLAEGGEPMAVFLEGRIREAVAALAERRRQVLQLVRELDHDRFAAREKAMRELTRLPPALVAPLLREGLQSPPSLEAMRRMDKLLAKMAKTPPDPAVVQLLRAMEALEHAATPRARAILRELARRGPEDPLTREARASLERLAR
jgi:WD40 repeat protein